VKFNTGLSILFRFVDKVINYFASATGFGRLIFCGSNAGSIHFSRDRIDSLLVVTTGTT
jgi:hypothetical protein